MHGVLIRAILLNLEAIFLSRKTRKMKHQSSKSLSFLTLIIFILIFSLVKLSTSNDEQLSDCTQPFQCGNINDLKYPFWGVDRPSYCGLPEFELQCITNNNFLYPTINISSQTYRILLTDIQEQQLTVARADYWDNFCPSALIDTNIDTNLFDYIPAPTTPNPTPSFLTFIYGCPNTTAIGYDFPGHSYCDINGSRIDVVYRTGQNFADKVGCNVVNIPIHEALAPGQDININAVRGALREGFQLKWKANSDQCKTCEASGGKTHTRPKFMVVILASISGTGIGICVLIALSLYRKRIFPSERRMDIEVFLNKHGCPGPKRYTYSDLKRITNFFKDKLGEGGYGVVYRGKLHDGHQVAVKILKKSSDEDMEEFINEVASIGKTNHINIVKLLRFCYEGGHKRALVYNYMPNGSLEKFTYSGQKNHHLLSWEKLFDIVIGIARGLEYLHIGCETRILHFDIKPQNILLDENFCPKISDFGLAKSCQQKDSIISMSEARGTIGYIAPEVFFKQMGGVSHKSDVYSFGMLVLEMIGCRNNPDARVESISEQYFPEWIYRQLEQVELDQQEGISNVEEESLRRKMILVSLWCIQTHPTTRPNMSRVVEMLGGALNSLQIPPMPSLVHPFTSQQNSSTISVGRLFQE